MEDVTGDTKAVEGWMEMAETYVTERFKTVPDAHPALIAAYVNACALASLREVLKTDVVNALDGRLQSLRDAVARLEEDGR